MNTPCSNCKWSHAVCGLWGRVRTLFIPVTACLHTSFFSRAFCRTFHTAPTRVSRTPSMGSRTTALECPREHRRGASRIPPCASARMDLHQPLEGSGASVFSRLHWGLEGAGCQKRKMDYPGPFRFHGALQWELGSLCMWRTYFWTIANVARLGWGLPDPRLGSVSQPVQLFATHGSRHTKPVPAYSCPLWISHAHSPIGCTNSPVQGAQEWKLET